MLLRRFFLWPIFTALAFCISASVGHAEANVPAARMVFPTALESYQDPVGGSLLAILKQRIDTDPFNAVATGIFFLAIVHTFLAGKFRHWAHAVEEAHAAKCHSRLAAKAEDEEGDGRPPEVSFLGQTLHFFGEIEAIFGIWVVVLSAAIISSKGWDAAVDYIGHTVNFTEPMFVVVIMALASTRPVMRAAQRSLRAFAAIGKGTVAAWWLSILIIAPLLGSFITEPAAMTIGALLLARQFYALKPSPRLAYSTLGLLFVNISVGGTLTHFAAPPVLMVAAPWKWDMAYMFTHFGWRAASGVVLAALLYYLAFRKELAVLEKRRQSALEETTENKQKDLEVPLWITLVQLGFMVWTVFVAHYPALFIGGFLFFLAFSQATAHHQSRLDLRPSLLVGFFLAGLVIHGGVQGWWIEPVLKNLGDRSLFFVSTALTAFNDNAAITYLATLVPGFTDAAKYAVVAGAVTGGGLTVIANAPNPAGQSILQQYFPDGISPLRLFLGAVPPTFIMVICFLI